MQQKNVKLVLDDLCSFLGMDKGCFTIKDKNRNVEHYPLFEKEIGEVVLKSCNCVSTGALASLGFWDINFMIMTQRGADPVAILKSLDEDNHVKIKLCQYEAYNNPKGITIAKQFVISKLEDQNQVLRKHGLRNHCLIFKELQNLEGKSLDKIRTKLHGIEGRYKKQYFDQIFQL